MEHMNSLALHEFHHSLNARFGELNGMEVVAQYGDTLAEHRALRESAGVLDFSFRSRICLTGADRVRFLHGQVTNDIKRLRVGEGCYAALVTAKGKMESDLNVYCLQDELLLDFEPGMTEKISKRLETFIVADDVQVVDVASHYGLLSVQGPRAEAAVRELKIFSEIPGKPFQSVKISDATLGEIYLINQPRIDAVLAEIYPMDQPGTAPLVPGFDIFVPLNSLGAVADKLNSAAIRVGGRASGWNACETARIEAAIPRFRADMDEINIPLECGIETRAVSYSKGCYIGQEVINRIHTIGHVNKELRGLRLEDGLQTLPARGDKLFHEGREVGYVTSAVKSPALNASIALGYVRRDANQVGTELALRGSGGETKALIVQVPFVS